MCLLNTLLFDLPIRRGVQIWMTKMRLEVVDYAFIDPVFCVLFKKCFWIYSKLHENSLSQKYWKVVISCLSLATLADGKNFCSNFLQTLCLTSDAPQRQSIKPFFCFVLQSMSKQPNPDYFHTRTFILEVTVNFNKVCNVRMWIFICSSIEWYDVGEQIDSICPKLEV